MSDPIEFNPLGTITVEFDDQTYTLTRPKMGQWRYFKRLIEERRRDNQAKLDHFKDEAERINILLTEAKTKVQKEKFASESAKLQTEWSEFASTPAWEQTIPWVVEVFAQLGDKPLPENPDDWPAWLAADASLPTAILAHWQTRPKASGVEAP